MKGYLEASRDQVDRRGAPADCCGSAVPGTPARGWRRLVHWVLAGSFFALAMIGVVLPGIPTTPFLLLMCHSLIRVSPELHAQAMAWPLVGGPLRDWHDQRGLRRSVRVTACVMVLLLVGATLLFGTLPLSVKTVILGAAGCGLVVIARLPAAQPTCS